jgi:hypothetical protein
VGLGYFSFNCFRLLTFLLLINFVFEITEIGSVDLLSYFKTSYLGIATGSFLDLSSFKFNVLYRTEY